ncbi:MAG: ABC transporter substrate-binding protein [Deltaproteobacteria bacterium]|nr:ABC transporter substrate-binding protein [Deltaproteobacteria bacterium]
MITRRELLKQGALAGAGLAIAGGMPGLARGSNHRRVTIAQGVDIISWDPYGHSVSTNYGQWLHVMEALVSWDYDRKRYVPSLAESWKAEGNTWTFGLRRGVRFHSGDPLTARDVAYSYERIKRSPQQGAVMREVREVKVLDDHTVQVVTHKPAASFIARLTNRVILSEQAARKDGADMDRHPIGTGPFRFVEWVRGSHFTMRRHEGYWGSPAQVDTLVWKPIPEDAARVTAIESGGADIISNVPPHEVERLERHPDIRIDKIRGDRIMFLTLSPRFKPFQDRRVRLAMNHAIDVDSLIKFVLDGRAYRLVGPVGPSVFGYDPSLKPYPYDPARAKQLLAEAGYPNGFEVDFHSPSGRYLKDREIAQAVAGQLAKVGIRARLITPEWSILWSEFTAGKYNFVQIGRGDVVDGDEYLTQYFGTNVTKRLGYSNPQLDRLLDEQRQIFDQDRREKVLQQAVRLIHEEAPCVFLYNFQDLYGSRKRVTWKPQPNEYILMWRASLRG